MTLAACLVFSARMAQVAGGIGSAFRAVVVCVQSSRWPFCGHRLAAGWKWRASCRNENSKARFGPQACPMGCAMSAEGRLGHWPAGDHNWRKSRLADRRFFHVLGRVRVLVLSVVKARFWSVLRTNAPRIMRLGFQQIDLRAASERFRYLLLKASFMALCGRRDITVWFGTSSKRVVTETMRHA